MYFSNFLYKKIIQNTILLLCLLLLLPLKDIESIISLLDTSIDEDGENNITWGNIIKAWYDSVIDTYKKTISDSYSWLAEYQAQLISDTSITNLKIKFTNASWYFIEISKSQISLVPSTFIHKQTLANAARFITQELIDFQSSLFDAQNNMASKEYDIFQNVREKIMSSYKEMKLISSRTAYIDFLSGLSLVAYKRKYTCPKISSDYGCKIIGWRHPVIETIENDFIQNDLSLNKNDKVHIITGPNMWGKSTFLRQNALIVLMAHIGSYVPVSHANIWITDKIFSRVGANDNLFLWKSTFMVEMQEVSHILNNATKDSFIIIDEVWRGTSTYDGMSLAWGILKYIHDTLGTKTLFATHYHEIIDESSLLKSASNYSVAVGENEENLVFLRKIIPWGIKKSYGLEVAKIAWIKKWVLDDARQMVKRHQWTSQQFSEQLSFSSAMNINSSPIIDELLGVNTNILTPLEALNLLVELQKKSKK